MFRPTERQPVVVQQQTVCSKGAVTTEGKNRNAWTQTCMLGTLLPLLIPQGPSWDRTRCQTA